MTANQLRFVKRIRNKLDDIRGNEDEVSELKAEVDELIHDAMTEMKTKIDVFASPDNFDSDHDIPF